MDISKYINFWIKNLSSRKKFYTKKYESILEINFPELFNQGYRLIIFDYDDTLTFFHGDLNSDVKDKIQEILNIGFKVGVLSNLPEHRKEPLIKNFKELNVFLEFSSNKPNPIGYFNIMKNFNIDKSKSVMIGDRLGADLYGAHLAEINMKIIVEPFSDIFGGKKPGYFYRLLRNLEKILN